MSRSIILLTLYHVSGRKKINMQWNFRGRELIFRRISLFVKHSYYSEVLELNVCNNICAVVHCRPLFENFVQDLLSTVNKPEWPASELMLSLLGQLLVNNFSNKNLDMSMRTSSLEYLGVVAARLRKDAVQTKIRQEVIDDILRQICDDNNDDDDTTLQSKSKKKKKNNAAKLKVSSSFKHIHANYTFHQYKIIMAQCFTKQQCAIRLVYE